MEDDVAMKLQKRSSRRGLACVLALLASLVGSVGAEPLRISLDARADPGPVSAAASAVEAARFVPADPQPPQADAADAGGLPGEEGEREFVPALSLPSREAGAGLALPRPDEAQGVLRLVRGDGATATAPALPESRPLGAFGARVPGADPAASALGRGFDAPPTAPGVDAAAEDSFEPPRASAETAPSSLPASAAARAAASGHTRLITVFVVVPLVLAAMLMLWRLDRSGRHRRKRRAHGDASRARAR